LLTNVCEAARRQTSPAPTTRRARGCSWGRLTKGEIKYGKERVTECCPTPLGSAHETEKIVR
jgi:hypothetical protein